MKIRVQLTTMSGIIIDKAMWELDFSMPPAEGHIIQINVQTDDRDLISYSPKLQNHGVVFDGNMEDGFDVTFTCSVKKVKHMIDTVGVTAETLVFAVPETRASEQVMVYLFDKQKADIAFLKAVQGPQRV